MTVYLLKSITYKKKGLAAVIICSLTLSYIIMLLSASILYKFSNYAGICQVYIFEPELNITQIKDELDNLKKSDYFDIILYNEEGISVIYKGELWITAGRAPESSDEIIVSSDIAEIGDLFEIEGKEYYVSGNTARNGIYFGFEYINELGTVSEIEFNLKTFNNIKRKALELAEQFNSSEAIINNENQTIFEAAFSNPIFAVVFAVTALAVISVMFCIRYLIEEARKVFEVFKFCGARVNQIIDEMFLITGIILCAVFIIGSILFAILDATVLNGDYSFFGIKYKLVFFDYIMVFIIITALTVLTMIPNILNTAKTDIKVKSDD